MLSWLSTVHVVGFGAHGYSFADTSTTWCSTVPHAFVATGRCSTSGQHSANKESMDSVDRRSAS